MCLVTCLVSRAAGGYAEARCKAACFTPSQLHDSKTPRRRDPSHHGDSTTPRRRYLGNHGDSTTPRHRYLGHHGDFTTPSTLPSSLRAYLLRKSDRLRHGPTPRRRDPSCHGDSTTHAVGTPRLRNFAFYRPSSSSDACTASSSSGVVFKDSRTSANNS